MLDVKMNFGSFKWSNLNQIFETSSSKLKVSISHNLELHNLKTYNIENSQSSEYAL